MFLKKMYKFVNSRLLVGCKGDDCIGTLDLDATLNAFRIWKSWNNVIKSINQTSATEADL